MNIKSKKSYKFCERFYVDQWGNERTMIHSVCVIETCLNIIKGTNLDSDVFIIAGWIHDLGRKVDKEDHHMISLSFLDRFLDLYPVFNANKDLIIDCIQNHRSMGKPETIYGEIFKVADKLALHHKVWMGYKNKDKGCNYVA